MELLREWLFPALQTHFMPTRRLCQPKLDSTSPCLSLSCLPRMQLQALASCQAPPPTLCACALYACSYSATIRAYFLSNSLHSNVRKYTSLWRSKRMICVDFAENALFASLASFADSRLLDFSRLVIA